MMSSGRAGPGLRTLVCFMRMNCDPSASIPDNIRQDLQAMGLVAVVDEAVLARLSRYLDLLLETNRRFNLTAVRDRDAAWRRLILDSLTLLAGLEGLPDGSTLIDVGSGGGLPGIPIAIAKPDLKVTLLETTGKKAQFLEQCASDLGLVSVRVVHGRAETVGQDPVHRQSYDVAVTRGVGPMNRILEYTLPLVRVGGWVYAIKGSGVQQELQDAGDALTTLGAGEVAVYEAYPPAMDQQDTLIVGVAKDKVTPKAYPRLPGVPAKSPL